jgi:hypothetical protein
METTRFDYVRYSKIREREFEKIHDRWDDSRGTRVEWGLFANVLEKKNISNVIPIKNELVKKENVVKKIAKEIVKSLFSLYRLNFKKSKPYKF